jgi:3-phenylpropionate/cinnamic acid dioxygenase small subunit
MSLSLQELSDREEIRDLLVRWARAVDIDDFDMFVGCYTDDVVIDFHEIGYQGSTGTGHREFLEQAAPFFDRMHHHITNVTFHELTHSTARTSCMVYAATKQHDGTTFFIGAWYHDELRKVGGKWRIAKRYAEKVYDHNTPADLVVPQPTAGSTSSSRDPESGPTP